MHPALVSSPETLDVAGEARRETRAKQAKPVGFSLGETRAKQGGPVGNLVQRCTPALALRQETSKKSGSPRDAEEAVGHRKPGCRNRVQRSSVLHLHLLHDPPDLRRLPPRHRRAVDQRSDRLHRQAVASRHGKKLTRNYFLASQRTARWEGRRLDPGCLKLTGCRLKS